MKALVTTGPTGAPQSAAGAPRDDVEARLDALDRLLAGALPGAATGGGSGGAAAVLARVETRAAALVAAWTEKHERSRRREVALEELLTAVASLGSLDFEALRRVPDPEDDSLCALLVGLQMMAEEIAHASGEVMRARDTAVAARAGLEAANAALAERSAELDAANRSLEQAMRMKDEFLANMSHELRTPLNAVLGFAEALSGEVYGPVNARQQGALARIDGSGRHLVALIDDILDLARIGAGRISLVSEPVELASVCEEAVAFVRAGAIGRGLSVSCEAPEPVLVQSDRRRVLQVVLNLLSNAVKFTTEGSVGVRLSVDVAAGEARLAVWDTGIGIAPEDRPNLFRAFVQLEGGLSRRYGGTGLGLALSRALADLLRGRIELSSERGQGSCFTLTLPLPA
jgi:signal transduction histidine kinase